MRCLNCKTRIYFEEKNEHLLLGHVIENNSLEKIFCKCGACWEKKEDGEYVCDCGQTYICRTIIPDRPHPHETTIPELPQKSSKRHGVGCECNICDTYGHKRAEREYYDEQYELACLRRELEEEEKRSTQSW